MKNCVAQKRKVEGAINGLEKRFKYGCCENVRSNLTLWL